MEDWIAAPGAWTGRFVFLRALGAIYLVAFLVARNQWRPLLGEHGLTPVARFLPRTTFRRSPSLLHWRHDDRFVTATTWVGIALAAAATLGLTDVAPLPVSMLVWLALWALYLSLVNVGQTWYSFGWETLLLETGLLAVFLGSGDAAPPTLILLLLRWLLFRVEFGAGLIKLRGDPCWRDLTCLRYHHETQPMPGPLSWWFHHLPDWAHRVEVAANHAAQLVIPFGLFLPQPASGIAAAVMLVTQLWLVLSGNFSWLNWLTIALALPVLPWPGRDDVLADPATWHLVLVVAFTTLVLVLSIRPARNLLSRRQLMNSSFDPLHIVNTYGAFGSITRERHEVVLEGSRDGETWLEYGFKGKPGEPGRRPRQFAPYHLRLDWLLWFVAISPGYAGSWFTTLVRRLLEGDRATLRLLRHDPFPDAPPTWVRARLFRYRFTTWAERRATGDWWVRTPESTFLRPVRLDDL